MRLIDRPGSENDGFHAQRLQIGSFGAERDGARRVSRELLAKADET